jgi:hypothetical protein
MTTKYFPQGLSAFLGIEDEYEGPSPPKYKPEDRVRLKGEQGTWAIQPFESRDFFARFFYSVKPESGGDTREVSVWDIEKL